MRDRNQKNNSIAYMLTVPHFFKNKDSLTLVLASNSDRWDTSYSYVAMLRNGKV